MDNNNQTPQTPEEVLAQLKKEGVTNLEEFAEFLVKKAKGGDDPNGPIVNSAIIYNHGFVSH